MGWRELSVQNDRTINVWDMLRGWLLVGVVSALAGWGLVDMTLSLGGSAGVQVAVMEDVSHSG